MIIFNDKNWKVLDYFHTYTRYPLSIMFAILSFAFVLIISEAILSGAINQAHPSWIVVSIAAVLNFAASGFFIDFLYIVPAKRKYEFGFIGSLCMFSLSVIEVAKYDNISGLGFILPAIIFISNFKPDGNRS